MYGFLAIGVVVLIVAAWLIARDLNRRVDGDTADMLGREGEAQETFSDAGMVLIRGELWRARTRRDIIERGDRVRVIQCGPGLELVVKRVNKDRSRDSHE